MKRITTILTFLMLVCMGVWADATYYIPTNRATTFSSDKMYMIYNTCYDPTSTEGNEYRAGFIYIDANGDMKKMTTWTPKQFSTNSTVYLWKITTGDDNHVSIQNVSNEKYYGPDLGKNNSAPNTLYLYPWGTNSEKQSGVSSQKEDDPSQNTAKENITFATNKVFIIGNGDDTFWNGNPGDIVTWSTGHPFAFYEVEEVTVPSGYNGYVGPTKTIGATEWQTQNNWALNDPWKGNGPGYSSSDMWSPIYLQNVTATGIAFEGWNLRLKLVNSSLTATTVKLQTGVASTIDVDESSTLNLTLSTSNNGPWTRTFNIDGNLTINMGAQSWSTGSNTNTINLGTTGQFTFTANSGKTTHAASSFTINATLTDPTANNTIESRTLATFTNVTVSTLSHNISGTDGWTLVSNKDALDDQLFNGKYYYVETTASGVVLHTFNETSKSTTLKLSEITDYATYSQFIVPSGSTLEVDVANFDLTKITGAGTIVLDADNNSLSGSTNKSTVATGKLTINEGKTLSIGSGDSQTHSIESFTSIDLAGTITHNNKKATLNNVTVPAGKTGKIFAYDMGNSPDEFKLSGTTTLNGNLTVLSRWNAQIKVDELSGSGTWLICGTTGDSFDATGTTSSQDAIIKVGSSLTFTGTIHEANTKSQLSILGTLKNCTLKGTAAPDGYPKLEDGAVLDGVILEGSKRIGTTGSVTIKDLAGNNLSETSNSYAFIGSGTLNFEGTCDLTKKSDNSENTCAHIGYPSGNNIVIKTGATVTAANFFNSSGNNAAITVNGSITATYFGGTATLAEGSTTTLSDATPFDGAVTVSGNATLNLTATTATLGQTITVAAGKTLTIDGGSNTINLTVVPTLGTGSNINLKNATVNCNNDIRSLTDYTFTSCTARFTETGDEYKAGGFTITNIPSGVTIKVKKYGTTEYETETPTDGTVTISHSVGVSGTAAWLDYTFNETTKATNIHSPADRVIANAGNAGSGNDLTIDTGYDTDKSYNADGTLKVMSTPYRSITWPTNYTVAVAGNVPDVENGCLVAFGTHDGGYLAILRGDANNKILLVKGKGNNAFEVITTMTAANATALSHLVVFTKNGNTFTVYLDGVQKTQVTYSETLGGGLQIGSLHGGVTDTNIERVSNMSEAARAKVFAKAIRVYDYVISAGQMSQLTTEFPYTSFGGKYTRTISANSNLSATNAWRNASTQGDVDVPVNAVEDAVTYYPDVEITTTANSTLTVNADMDAENIKFEGAGKLTIVSDGTHNIHVYGSVTANGPVSVKYDEIDLTAVPVTVGETGSIEFDFSDSDFSGVYDVTEYPVTGNTSDYGSKVTGVYPSDTESHTYSLAHDGTNNRYVLTVAPTVALKRQQAIDLVAPYYDGRYVGAGLGKYTISLGETSYLNMTDFLAAVTAWASLEDCVEPTIEINKPATGKFYRFNIGDNYMCNVAVGNIRTATTTANDASTIFCLYDENYLIAYADGFGFNYSYCKAVSPGIFNAFSFTESTTKGAYVIQASTGTGTASGSSRYITINSEGTSLAEGQGAWTISEVSTLPVTISTAQYATLYSPVALTIPSGVKAYTGVVNDDKLTLSEVETTIPANTAVVLKADPVINKSTTFNFETTTSEAFSGNNDLAGYPYAKTKDEGDLVLGNGTHGIGFYGLTGTTLAGFKAYLPAAKVSDARELRIVFADSETTGIESLTPTLSEGEGAQTIYDLQGRKVANPSRGMYIVNGKKGVIK